MTNVNPKFDRQELHLPTSPNRLVNRLRLLHLERRNYPRPLRRLSLTPAQRAEVLKKADKRCHLCGGTIGRKKSFAADHVKAHAARGEHTIANYLPAHRLCNGCRWFYSPEEFKWILRMGIWLRKKLEDQSNELAAEMLLASWKNEHKVRIRQAKQRGRG